MLQTQTKPLSNNGFIVEWSPDNTKEVDEAKGIFRRAHYYERRKVVTMDQQPMQNFKPNFGGFKVLPKELTENQLAIRIHDETGDRRLIWDSNDPDEIQEAAEKFNEYLEKGWRAYAVSPSGEKGKRVYRFDPDKEEMVISDMKLSVKLKDFVKSFGEVIMLPKTYPG